MIYLNITDDIRKFRPTSDISPELRKLSQEYYALAVLKYCDKQRFGGLRKAESPDLQDTAKELGYTPVVPPKKNRIDPWEYDEELYKRRNEVERFFRRIKRFRRVFTRYDKLDIVFAGFILFAMIVDALV